jgi:hypothetical protein
VFCFAGPGPRRVHALRGDIVKARADYQDFLTLWKDADPDIPIQKQAKVEYLKAVVTLDAQVATSQVLLGSSRGLPTNRRSVFPTQESVDN